MLTEETRQLLAAYVDGEVSPRQRAQVDSLLSKSAEARNLLEQLQRDSGELRAMKRKTLPQDFSLQVLKNIADKKLQPESTPPPTTTFPAWLGITIAVAVLVLVTVVSFLFFAMR
jgi:anti-sigma factor RsiW